ncbi:MAG: hypothetical protein SFX18_11910 [Pirellulales bacterium]|nr:hypothetical protein [Pirellulales bacterium]
MPRHVWPLFVGILAILPLCLGCEGSRRTGTPFAAPDPKSAKPPEQATYKGGYEQSSVNPDLPGAVVPTATTTEETPMDMGETPPPLPSSTLPEDVLAKLDKLKEELGIGAPVLLPNEVKKVVSEDAFTALHEKSTGALETFTNQIGNADTKTRLMNVQKKIKAYRAEKGRAPRTVKEFAKTLTEDSITLPELAPGEYYVYDPKLAAKEANDENLDYLVVVRP